MSDATFARYKLLRRLGSGGMAEVFLAELVGAEGVTRELVVKKVKHSLAADQNAIVKFVDEARIAARLHHPNVVQVYEFGRSGDDYFLAMELVEGCDLAQLVKSSVGGLGLGASAWVMSELLAALAYVHELTDSAGNTLGLVHRDVTPHNVLLGREGEVKLGDFGIARATALSGNVADVEGKLAFMAPEQARGEPVDARADQFAAGAIFYELLVGRRVYENDGEAICAARDRAVTAVRSRAPEVPVAIARVVDRALSVDRSARFETTRQMLDALRSALVESGVVADREALRRRVCELETVEREGKPRAERTLTVEGEASPEIQGFQTVGGAGIEGVEGLDRHMGQESKPARRKFLERAVLAVGVAVVAMLAERRTRPVLQPRARVVSDAVTVTIGVPEDERFARWPDGAAARELPARCRCRPRVVRYRSVTEVAEGLRTGRIDAALLEGGPLGALVTTGAVRRVDTAMATVNAEGYLRASRGLELEAQRLGQSVGAEGEGMWMFPLAVDALAVAVRRQRLESARREFASHESELRERLRRVGLMGLPTGFAPTIDDRAWTTWDLWALAALAENGSRSEIAGGAAMWIPSVSARDGMTVWRSRETLHTPGPEVAALTAGWDALSLRTGVARRGRVDDVMPPWSDESLALAWIHSSAWSSLAEIGGWSLARPPRGDGWILDSSGDITHVGRRALPARIWGVCLGRGSGHVAATVRWVLAVVQGDASLQVAHALNAWPAIENSQRARPRGGYVPSLLRLGELTAIEGSASPQGFDASNELTARALTIVVDRRTPLSLPAIEALFAPASTASQ